MKDLRLGMPSTGFEYQKISSEQDQLEEFDNLNKLAQQNPELVVKPDYYFANDNREMYIAPYYFQARCIANQENG